MFYDLFLRYDLDGQASERAFGKDTASPFYFSKGRIPESDVFVGLNPGCFFYLSDLFLFLFARDEEWNYTLLAWMRMEFARCGGEKDLLKRDK